MTRLRAAIVAFRKTGQVPRVMYVSRDIFYESMGDRQERMQFNCQHDLFEGIPIILVVPDGIVHIY